MYSSKLIKQSDTSGRVTPFSIPDIDSITVTVNRSSDSDDGLSPGGATLREPPKPVISEVFKAKINAIIARSREDAQGIVREASAEAERIKIDAHEKAHSEGFQKGFSEGVEQGVREGVERLAPVLDAVRAVLDKLTSIDKHIGDDMERALVGLSLAVAEKIVNAELKTNREIIVDTVRNAIRFATDRGEITIKINPDDYHTLSRYKNDFLESVDGISRITFVEDESIPSGNCVIDTNIGEIDARFRSQLDEIGQAFTAELATKDPTVAESDYL